MKAVKWHFMAIDIYLCIHVHDAFIPELTNLTSGDMREEVSLINFMYAQHY